jgi:hypothetical protein
MVPAQREMVEDEPIVAPRILKSIGEDREAIGRRTIPQTPNQADHVGREPLGRRREESALVFVLGLLQVTEEVYGGDPATVLFHLLVAYLPVLDPEPGEFDPAATQGAVAVFAIHVAIFFDCAAEVAKPNRVFLVVCRIGGETDGQRFD